MLPALSGAAAPAAEREAAAGDVTEPRSPAAVEPHAVRPPVDASMSVDLSGLRVVVVDDEPDAREVITRILTHAGAETTSAASVRDSHP